LHATDGQGTDTPDQLFGGWGGDGIGGDDGDTMSGGHSRDDFYVYLDESDDQAVVITDFSADHARSRRRTSSCQTGCRASLAKG
jgi:hypothetical protein